MDLDTLFDINYESDRLVLHSSGLSSCELEYLQSYIARLNRHQKIATWGESPVFSLYQPPPASKAGIRSLQYRLLRRFKQLRVPATATIAIAKACQCDCTHCSAVYYNHSSKKVLGYEDCQLAIMQSIRLGASTIILLGGEPMLNPRIIELLNSVPKDHAHVIMFSNGEFFTPEICRQLKLAGLMGVFVSIDSTNADEHDRLRKRPGLFGKALAGINNLQREGILVGISSYLSHSRMNSDVFHRMMEFGKELAVNELTFFDAIPTGNWLHHREDLLTADDRLKIQSWVKMYRNMKGYPGLAVQSTMTSECGSAYCFAANTQFYLTAFGDMCPCDFTPLSIGKFPEFSIAELWNKMIHTPPYNERAKSCRLQDESFYQTYLANIPSDSNFPVRLGS